MVEEEGFRLEKFGNLLHEAERRDPRIFAEILQDHHGKGCFIHLALSLSSLTSPNHIFRALVLRPVAPLKRGSFKRSLIRSWKTFL